MKIRIGLIFLFLLFSHFSSPQKVKVPFSIRYNPSAIAKYITKGVNSDLDKANIIAEYICDIIKYDVRRWRKARLKRHSSKQVILRRRALCDEYAKLYKDMLSSVGINSFVVLGSTKDFMYDVHDEFYRSNHAWNALYIDRKFYLADLTFAAGYLKFVDRKFINGFLEIFNRGNLPARIKFVKKYNGNYVMNDPSVFEFDHIPVDPVWFLKGYREISRYEHDSIFYKKRDRFVPPNKIMDYGVTSNEALIKLSDNHVKSVIKRAKASIDFNYKNEEFAIEAKVLLADSLFNKYKSNLSGSIKKDSIKSSIEMYNDANYYLRCHGRNLKHEYSFLIKKEKYKLNQVKFENKIIRNDILNSKNILNNFDRKIDNLKSNLKEKIKGGYCIIKLPTSSLNFNFDSLSTSNEIKSFFLSELDSLSEILYNSILLEKKSLFSFSDSLKRSQYYSLGTNLILQSLIAKRKLYKHNFRKEVRILKDSLIKTSDFNLNYIMLLKSQFSDFLICHNKADSIYLTYKKLVRLKYKQLNAYIDAKGGNVATNTIYKCINESYFTMTKLMEIECDTLFLGFEFCSDEIGRLNFLLRLNQILSNREILAERNRAKKIIKLYVAQRDSYILLNKRKEREIGKKRSQALKQYQKIDSQLSDKNVH